MIIQGLNVISGVTIMGRQEKVNEGDDITIKNRDQSDVDRNQGMANAGRETRKSFSYGASRKEAC